MSRRAYVTIDLGYKKNKCGILLCKIFFCSQVARYFDEDENSRREADLSAECLDCYIRVSIRFGDLPYLRSKYLHI